MNWNVTWAILLVVGNWVMPSLIQAYIPDKNKINSFIKKSALFTLKYILPIAGLIWIMTDDNVKVDKSFILKVALLISSCLFYIAMEFLLMFAKEFRSRTNDLLSLISKITDNMNTPSAENIEVLRKEQERLLKKLQKILRKR